MTINNTYSSIQQQNQQRRHQQQNFGDALAPIVGVATFIENNGFIGEFLTVDTFGMATPRAVQGYTRNSKELGHLNYKAGREETVRELISGPAYFFVPLIILTLATLLKGKATKVTTDTLDVFKSVMKNTSKNIKDMKDSKDIKTKFIDNLLSNAFDENEYKNERGQITKIKEIITNATEYKSKNFLGLFDKKKKGFKEELSKAITTLNKANGKFIDSTTLIEVTVKENDKTLKKQLNLNYLLSDIPNYLENITKSAEKSSSPIEKFVEDFHKNAKRIRQTTNILAAAALAAFLAIVPKFYKTGNDFPGLEGLDTTNAPAKKRGAK